MEPITLTAFAIGKLIAMKLGAAHLGTAALTAIGAAAIGTIITVGVLTIYEIASWFQKRRQLAGKTGNICFTLKTKLDSGDHGIVQGIMNRNASNVEAARVIQHDSLDSEMQQAHRYNDLVIYPVD